MNTQHLHLNPKSLKSKFIKGFLRALMRIRRQKPSSCCPKEIFQRYDSIKTAADKSLASAVGSRRIWSRAMLCKIRNQARRRRALVRRRIINNQSMKKQKRGAAGDQEVGFGQASDLRKLVPGGEAMDLCRLLDEAAHYIKCLNTQVQVMGCIADFYSA